MLHGQIDFKYIVVDLATSVAIAAVSSEEQKGAIPLLGEVHVTAGQGASTNKTIL